MPVRPSILKQRWRPTRRGWMLIAVVGALLSSVAADAVASAGRIRSGVSVGSLELGGRRFDDAERLLTKRAKSLATAPVLFRASGETLTLGPETIGFFPDVDATLSRAKRAGREGNIVVKLWQAARTYVASSDVGWRTEVNEGTAKDVVRDWASKFDNAGHEAGIRADADRIVPVDPLPGRKLDRAHTLDRIRTALVAWPRKPLELPFQTRGRRTDAGDAEGAAARANELVRAPVSLVSQTGGAELTTTQLARMLEAVPRKRFRGWGLDVRFSPDLVQKELEPRMTELERQSRDATFVVRGSSVTVNPSQDGLKFDAQKTASALDDVAKADPPRSTDVAFTVEHPKLTTDDAKALRINELVSTFTTNHPAGQSRVKNIHLIADTVDGTIVRPGESFSLNRKVGERTADKGYVLAPMIYDGEYKDQVGGGVSQFATTIFNAVFFGGYDFETYKAHSYYIGRYPAGRDATVSWPAPDFKFKNDSSSGVLIKTSYTGTSLTVSFYGDKEGRTVEAQTEDRSNPQVFTEKREEDPTLPPGTEKVKQKGEDGFDIVVWRIITRDGKSKREKFFTRYLPEPRIISFGPGTPAPASPEPTPTPQGTPQPTPSRPTTPRPATPRPTPSPNKPPFP